MEHYKKKKTKNLNNEFLYMSKKDCGPDKAFYENEIG